MKSNSRPGCLSPLALITAGLTVLILVVVEVLNGNAMFSPGALNAQSGMELGGVTAHAQTGSRCGACHTAPWSADRMSDRCLVCHSAIQTELQNPASLHGVLAQQGSLVCQSCHVEHNGPAASLTSITAADFPHEATGYALTAHALRTDGTPFVCADCHPQGLSTFSEATCDGCHNKMDAAYSAAHRQDFGAACLACHDGLDRYSEFDHAGTAYPLTGAHQQAACAGCHVNARATADFQTAPDTCAGCHQRDDAHAGQFGSQCEACHQPTRWEDATFDHSRSGFPLDGAHAVVECAACHRDQVYAGTPDTCAGCHAEPEYHAGLFAGQACDACHNTTAWRPARYDGPHTFPMNHGEQNNTCADCHQPNLNQWTCYTCHDQAEIASKHREEGIADFSDCLKCHPTGLEEEGEGGGGDD